MADHLTDEEQLQQLKNWWKENGTSLIAAILLGLIAYFGYQWWENYQRQQAEQASALYAELQESIEVKQGETLSDDKRTTANYLIKQLQDEYATTQYAINANFIAAKIAVDADDLAAAVTPLSWVIDNGDSSAKALAELRLARVYIALKQYDDALNQLTTEKADNYVSLVAELKGDAYMGLENWVAARTAYQEAIDSLGDTTSFRRRLLPIKLANVPMAEDS